MGRRFVPFNEWAEKNLRSVEFPSVGEVRNGVHGVWVNDGVDGTPHSGAYVRHEWKEFFIGLMLFGFAVLSGILALMNPFTSGLSIKMVGETLGFILFALLCARYAAPLLDGRMQIIEYTKSEKKEALQ